MAVANIFNVLPGRMQNQQFISRRNSDRGIRAPNLRLSLVATYPLLYVHLYIVYIKLYYSPHYGVLERIILNLMITKFGLSLWLISECEYFCRHLSKTCCFKPKNSTLIILSFSQTLKTIILKKKTFIIVLWILNHDFIFI